MTALDVARAAELRTGPVRGAEHAFHCARHDDKHASLLINEKKNCWMCAPCGGRGNAWALAAFLAGVDPGDKAGVAAWLRAHGIGNTNGNGSQTKTDRQIVATYDYLDERDALLFQVVRFEPKDFRQRKPDGTWNLQGVRRVLYRLAKVLCAVDVFIVEGEKDVHAIEAIGLVATTNSGGATVYTPAEMYLYSVVLTEPERRLVRGLKGLRP